MATSKTIIQNFSHFESLSMGLETFYQNADKGKAKFEELRKMSNETTFGVDELTNSFTQLANVGVDVDKINGQLKMLGDISGGSKEKFAELTSIFAKINSTGKAGSMQLQQIASRGVPIYKTLKEIGVTGVASAEDITKAFEKLTTPFDEATGKAGQFYGAMENINKTIEGKEGFISDYFKEMTVNFAELSGIADTYKSVLDVLKEAIGAVSDKFLEWNQNPLMKAIIQGVLKVAIVGLVGIIVGSLIPALTTVVGLLGAINPAVWIGGAVGAGIGLLAGVGNGLEAYKNKQQEINEEVSKELELRNKIVEKINSLTENDMRGYYDSVEKAYKDRIDILKSDVASKNGEIENYILSVSTNSRNWWKEINGQEITYTDEEVKNLKKLQDELAGINEQLLASSERLEVIKQRVNAFKTLDKYTEEVNKYLDKKNGISEYKRDYLELQKLLESGKQSFSYIENGEKVTKIFDLSDQERQNIKDTMEYLDALMNGSDEIKTWQQVFKGVTGIVVGHGTDTKSAGQIAGEEYAKQIQQALEQNINLAKVFNIDGTSNTADLIAEQMKKVQSDVTKLMQEKNVDNPFTTNDESIKAMIAKYKELETARKKALGQNMINNLTKERDQLKKILTESESLEEIELQIFVIEQGINAEDAKRLLGIQKETDALHKELDIAMQIKDALDNKDIMSYLQLSTQKAYNEGSYGKAFGLSMASSAINASNDATNFMQGMQSGGVWGGIINTFVGAIMEVTKSVEGANEVLNPITTAMYQLKPFITWLVEKLRRYTHHLEAFFNVVAETFEALEPLIDVVLDSLLEFINALTSIAGWIGKGIAPILSAFARLIASIIKVLTFGLFDGLKELNDSFAETRKEVDKTTEKFKDGNESLLKAMKEQEEWYLREKTALGAGTRADTYKVNDMILTPEGRFSTAPDDYIIATKNPSSLGKNNGVVVNFKVENTVSDQVEAKVQRVTNDDGTDNFIVRISRRIAQDVADGANGWDSAMNARNQRIAGRRLSI